jgi:putative oxidoreductase
MKTFLLKTNSLSDNYLALLLRITIGGLMIYHGVVKITSFDDILPYFPSLLGLGSQIELILVIFSEFLCGLLVLVGLLTRLAIIPIFITMFIAYFIAHSEDAFQTKELAFVFMILSIIVFVSGSGKISIDSLIIKNTIKDE